MPLAQLIAFASVPSGLAAGAAAWVAGAPGAAAAAAALGALAVASTGAAVISRRRRDPAPADADEAPEADLAGEIEALRAERDSARADAEALAETKRELLAALQAVQGGDLRKRLSADVDAEAADAFNGAVEAVSAAVDEVIALADLLGQGDISTPANGDHQGQLAMLRDGFNETQDGLRDMVSSALASAEELRGKSAEMDAAAADLHAMTVSQREGVAAVEATSAALATAVGTVGDVALTVKREAEQAVEVSEAGDRARVAANAAMDRLQADMREITGALSTISEIAQQTSLLAINASVEAVRAGAAGRGFAVVSNEVKTLATRSAHAASDITAIVERVERAAGDASGRIDECSELIATLAERVSATNQAADQIQVVCADQRRSLDDAKDKVRSLVELTETGERMAGRVEASAADVETVSRSLTGRLSEFRLDDPVMRDAVIERAAELSKRLEAEVDAGRISMEELFTQKYEPIPGAGPTQFMTAFVPTTDRIFPDILESALGIHDGVAFSAAVNTDGFLPTHNKKYSQPQSNDPVWNSANARNRRFFNDRVGLAAGRSRAEFLVQAYRRDMGGGAYVTMKDISAPIIVRGRHWGGLRIGYKLPTKQSHAPQSSAVRHAP